MLIRPIPEIKPKIKMNKESTNGISPDMKSEVVLSPEKLKTSDTSTSRDSELGGYINPVFQTEVENDQGSKGPAVIVPREENPCHSETDKKKRPAYKRLLTNVHFLRLLSMEIFTTVGAYGAVFMLPALAEERGYDSTAAALTVTVTGATELLAR